MLTFAEIRQEVESHLLRKQEPQRIKNWINEAERTICRAYPFRFLEKEATTPSTADSPNYYTLPLDLRMPIGVRVKDSAGVVRTIPTSFVQKIDTVIPDQTTSEDAGPNHGLFTGRLLLLIPGFKDALSTIIIRYLKTPSPMVNDSDLSVLPIGFRDTLIWGAVSFGSRWVWDDKGDQDRAQRRFDRGLQELIQSDQSGGDHNEEIGHLIGMEELAIDARV